MKNLASPGIKRNNRISDEGLKRLDKQLKSGRKISHLVLNQWVKRYGDQAQAIIIKYNPTFIIKK